METGKNHNTQNCQETEREKFRKLEEQHSTCARISCSKGGRNGKRAAQQDHQKCNYNLGKLCRATALLMTAKTDLIRIIAFLKNASDSGLVRYADGA